MLKLSAVFYSHSVDCGAARVFITALHLPLFALVKKVREPKLEFSCAIILKLNDFGYTYVVTQLIVFVTCYHQLFSNEVIVSTLTQV